MNNPLKAKVMKLKLVLIAGVCAAFLSSCAVTLPYQVTNNDLGTKKGVSSTVTLFSGLGVRAKHYSPAIENRIYLGLTLNKDFGIINAAQNGKISKIGAVDLKITNYVLFTKLEWVVSGQ